jgi:hypothetical protein
MEYFTGTTIEDLQVALGCAFAYGIGTGFTLSLIRFLVFDPVERRI